MALDGARSRLPGRLSGTLINGSGRRSRGPFLCSLRFTHQLHPRAPVRGRAPLTHTSADIKGSERTDGCHGRRPEQEPTRRCRLLGKPGGGTKAGAVCLRGGRPPVPQPGCRASPWPCFPPPTLPCLCHAGTRWEPSLCVCALLHKPDANLLLALSPLPASAFLATQGTRWEHWHTDLAPGRRCSLRPTARGQGTRQPQAWAPRPPALLDRRLGLWGSRDLFGNWEHTVCPQLQFDDTGCYSGRAEGRGVPEGGGVSLESGFCPGLLHGHD